MKLFADILTQQKKKLTLLRLMLRVCFSVLGYLFFYLYFPNFLSFLLISFYLFSYLYSFSHIRFVWMEYEQLVEVSANPRVPLRLMNEALLHRISLKERPSHQDPNELPVRYFSPSFLLLFLLLIYFTSVGNGLMFCL